MGVSFRLLTTTDQVGVAKNARAVPERLRLQKNAYRILFRFMVIGMNTPMLTIRGPLIKLAFFVESMASSHNCLAVTCKVGAAQNVRAKIKTLYMF